MEVSMATMSIVVFGLLFLTLGSGIWVGFSLFIVGFLGMVFFGTLPAGSNMASSLWSTVEKWEYVALPLFILMGEILYRSAIQISGPMAPSLTRRPVTHEYHFLYPIRRGVRFQCRHDRHRRAHYVG
jgi:hypothetical protein